MMGFLEDQLWASLVDKSTKETENRLVKSPGDEVLLRHTSSRAELQRLNLYLATDLLNEQHYHIPHNAKILRSLIGWQTPKYCGKVFVGSLHSPMELLLMAFKKIFYAPGFCLASTDPGRIYWNKCTEEKCAREKFGDYTNVIFEIDISEFPNFTTLLHPSTQTPKTSEVEAEKECLLSCYNIYEWTGYKLVEYNRYCQVDGNDVHDGGVIPVVSLKVKLYYLENDFEHNAVGGITDLPQQFLEEWLNHKGETSRNRFISPINLHSHFQSLIKSYSSSPAVSGNQIIDWVGRDVFSSGQEATKGPLCRHGRKIDGGEVRTKFEANKV